MPGEPPRALPVTAPLFGGETLGSYLTRLAQDNAMRTRALLSRIHPSLAHLEITPMTDTAARWPPAAFDRLTTLTGRRQDHLAAAIPALCDAHRDTTSPSPPGFIRACRRCAAAKNITVLIYLRARPHDHLCTRHRRWLRALRDIDISALPEITAAQRRHDRAARQHDDLLLADIHRRTRDTVLDWCDGQWHPALQRTWQKRAERLRISILPIHQQRSMLDVVIHPEHLQVASTLLKLTQQPNAKLKALENLARRLQLPEDALAPTSRDPIHRHLQPVPSPMRGLSFRG